MSTIISHSLIGAAIASFFRFENKKKNVITSLILGALPDSDTLIMGIFGRGTVFDHRGVFHSIFFAIIVGTLVAFLFKKNGWISSTAFTKLAVLFSAVTFSHPLADGFSTGWRYGVSYLAPFDMTKYFWFASPLPLAPLSPTQLITSRGANLFLAEAAMLWTFAIGSFLWNKEPINKNYRYAAITLWLISLGFWIILIANHIVS
jgi:inner membrane protein